MAAAAWARALTAASPTPPRSTRRSRVAESGLPAAAARHGVEDGQVGRAGARGWRRRPGLARIAWALAMSPAARAAVASRTGSARRPWPGPGRRWRRPGPWRRSGSRRASWRRAGRPARRLREAAGGRRRRRSGGRAPGAAAVAAGAAAMARMCSAIGPRRVGQRRGQVELQLARQGVVQPVAAATAGPGRPALVDQHAHQPRKSASAPCWPARVKVSWAWRRLPWRAWQ